MRKLLKLGTLLIVMILTLVPTLAQAFNSAAHIYIAERVFPGCSRKIDLYYGSIAPDLALFVSEPEKWETAFEDTHGDQKTGEYIDLRDFACPWSHTQRAFAKGWVTHNQLWGADFHANNYIYGKTPELLEYLESLGITGDKAIFLAHHAIEKAIDLLLKYNDDRTLPVKLLKANLFRSWDNRFLLVKVFVWKKRKTDWRTLATTELAFRNLTSRYAIAIGLPKPLDRWALAELGSELAREMYDVEISPEELLPVLEFAIELCEPDYLTYTKDTAIPGIQNYVNSR